MKHLIACALAICLTPSFAQAITVGQPFIEIKPDGPARILDFFDISGPTGEKEVRLLGTIESAVGWSNIVGDPFSISTSVIGTDTTPGMTELTIGSDTYTETAFEIFPSSSGPSDPEGDYGFDPLGSDGPGDLNIYFALNPTPVSSTLIGPDPARPGLDIFEFVYGGELADFGPRVTSNPELEVVLSIFVDGPLPTKTFDVRDSSGALIETITYIDGPFTATRATFGLVGGAPLPPAVIPLPASLSLLFAGVFGLGLLGRLRARRA